MKATKKETAVKSKTRQGKLRDLKPKKNPKGGRRSGAHTDEGGGRDPDGNGGMNHNETFVRDTAE